MKKKIEEKKGEMKECKKIKANPKNHEENIHHQIRHHCQSHPLLIQNGSDGNTISKNVIKVKNHEIVKNSLIIIQDFPVESLIESQINQNDLDELSNDFFSKIRKGLPGTPSRMRGNIFDKKRKADNLIILLYPSTILC